MSVFCSLIRKKNCTKGPASTFYFEGLGLTRDPYLRVGARTMWANAGWQQIHLPRGNPAQVVRGHIGLIMPSLEELMQRLRTIRFDQETLFSWEFVPPSSGDEECSLSWNYIDGFDPTKEGYVRVTGPYGNRFHCYQNTAAISFKGGLGIAYLEETCQRGTAASIARFYSHHFDAPTQVVPLPRSTSEEGKKEDDGLKVAIIRVGTNQRLIFREDEAEDERKDDSKLGYHVCIYVTRFSKVYESFRAADLLFRENRFDDRYDTLEQALEAHQFRFAKIVSTNEDEEGKKRKEEEDGATLHVLEHEVRSLGHPSFMRPLVNRIGTTGIYCSQ
ncbi:Glyoxalase, variant 3 [Balamuthia mandrillaris]